MPRRTKTADYELKRKNPITLGDDSNIEADLKPFKIDSKNSILELSESELKVRGTIDASAITVDGASVQTGTDAGATELNELSDVTYSGGDLTIDSIDTIISGDLTFDSSGDIALDAAGDQVHLKNGGTTFGFFDMATGSTLGLISNLNYHLKLASGGTGDIVLDSNGDVVLDSADGNFIAKVAGTEFSAPSSAYAGMILGYTCVGADRPDDSYTLTTSLVCFQDSGGTEIKVRFTTPPSEYVEIEVELYFSAGSSNKQLRLSLSDNATYASNGLAHHNQFEKVVTTPARGDGGTVTQKWLLQAATLEAIGSTNDIFIAAACDSTSGTPIIKWGGDATDEYTNLVLKATALPATIVEGS